MTKFAPTILIIAAGLCFAAPARAVTKATADAVAHIVVKTPKPTLASSDFEKWSFDTLRFTASMCWNGAYPGGRIHAALVGTVTRSGTFTLPLHGELEAACISLATKGFKPWCAAAIVTGDHAKPDTSLPRNYIQLAKYASPPAIKGSLYCYLNEEQKRQQVFTPNKLTTTWVVPPKPQMFNLSAGERTLNAGTVLIEVPTAPGMDGRPYSEPQTAVVPN